MESGNRGAAITSNMDPNNRFHLNLGGAGGYNSDRQYSATNARVYPTTPSTFPQPVFPNQQGAQETNDYLGTQLQNQAPQSPAAYGGGQQGGYFNGNPYQSQYNQSKQNQYQSQYQQQNVMSPQPSYQQRQTQYNTNDPTSGLAHQLSTQNLGGSQRQSSPYQRQPSPIQRPRTGGTPVQQSYGNHLAPSASTASMSSLLSGSSGGSNAEEPPEKNPEKYSSNVAKRGQGLHVLVEAFSRRTSLERGIVMYGECDRGVCFIKSDSLY